MSNKVKCRSNLCMRYGNFENGICPKCSSGGKGIKRVSDKRKVENAKYLKLRSIFLKEHPICEVTGRMATEVHHTYCGSKRSKYYLDVSTWMAVSREGHNWIHDNPNLAREKGYLK